VNGRLALQMLHYSIMRERLQTLAISVVLLASASAAQAQINFGIRIGPPPAPRAYRVPPQPGPDYVWVEGYHYPQGSTKALDIKCAQKRSWREWVDLYSIYLCDLPGCALITPCSTPPLNAA
jgi:hypothetical protein